MIECLALDLGTHTGYAFVENNVIMASTMDLEKSKEKGMDRKCDPRPYQLYTSIKAFAPQSIAFEDVQFIKYRAQAQLWSALRASIWQYASETKIPTFPYPVGTVKKFATNHGGATKEMMAAFLRDDKRFIKKGKKTFDLLTQEFLDDNAIDAYWILKLHLNKQKENK